MSEYSVIRIDRDEHVAHVVLANPKKGNAMGPAFWTEIRDAFRELDGDQSVRSVVLSAEGKAFTYGLDLGAMGIDLGTYISGNNLAGKRTALHDKIVSMQETFNAIEQCRKPVVAAVHGWCIGGGIEMISACDVRVCSADAKFSLREAKVAIVADMGGLQRLPYIVGEGHAREMAMTARDIDADRALRINLVNDVFADREAALAGATELAQLIAANPPVVVQGVKRVMNYSRDRSVEDGLRYVATWNSAFLQSEDLGEAFAAFLEKRPPKYTGQ